MWVRDCVAHHAVLGSLPTIAKGLPPRIAGGQFDITRDEGAIASRSHGAVRAAAALLGHFRPPRIIREHNRGARSRCCAVSVPFLPPLPCEGAISSSLPRSGARARSGACFAGRFTGGLHFVNGRQILRRPRSDPVAGVSLTTNAAFSSGVGNAQSRRPAWRAWHRRRGETGSIIALPCGECLPRAPTVPHISNRFFAFSVRPF